MLIGSNTDVYKLDIRLYTRPKSVPYLSES